jgi:large subunit ribosomal protein L25
MDSSQPAVNNSLEVVLREGVGKGPARRLREKGQVPAVVYSRGAKPLSVSVDPKKLREALAGVARFNTILKLRIAGEPGDRHVMLKDHQADPVHPEVLLHADFLEVRMDQKIRVEVPVVLIGKPIGVVEGGILQQGRRFLDVLSLPDRIPLKIEVDVAHLKIAQSIHVADLKVPEGVELKYATNFTIAVVSVPEKEEVAVVAPVVAEAGAVAAAPGAPGAPGGAPGAAPGAAGAPGAKPEGAPAKGGKPEEKKK